MTDFTTYQEKVRDENINSQTLLATDYLNHFNEVHMLMDMLPSMPDCIEDIREWAPKSYQEHFQDSVFAAKDLAIDAYAHSPDEYRLPFEETVAEMDSLILQTIAEVEILIEQNDMSGLQIVVENYTPKMIALIEKCGSIVNGEKHMTHQGSIDQYFDEDEEKLDGEDLDQSAIDDLFG
ncbi:hypothetical protein MNBD_ALPHA02-948 [hydrothermal vent metagenome]|uniref:Uncharacterized protein n=1 Tax=hydrothermal vent metagenome TaxID=652676 RepID=A0A3B0R2M5_9ZZZZ